MLEFLIVPKEISHLWKKSFNELEKRKKGGNEETIPRRNHHALITVRIKKLPNLNKEQLVRKIMRKEMAIQIKIGTIRPLLTALTNCQKRLLRVIQTKEKTRAIKVLRRRNGKAIRLRIVKVAPISFNCICQFNKTMRFKVS